MQRYHLRTDYLVGMAIDNNGDWVRYEDAAARIATLEAQLAAERERNRWVPCGERLPQLNKNVMLISNNEVTVGWRDVDCWMEKHAGRISGVTHWRELPEPPQEADHE